VLKTRQLPLLEVDKATQEATTQSVAFTAAALGAGLDGVNEMVNVGKIPSISFGKRKRRVPSTWLRQQLGLAPVSYVAGGANEHAA
jgi:hypothetical protein